MTRRFRHAFLGAALVAATVAAPPIASTAGAQASTWQGFTAISAPSVVEVANPAIPEANEAPAFSAAFTEDLGGNAADLWVNNHAVSSETLADFVGGTDVADLFDNVDRITPSGARNLSDSHVGVFTDIDGDGDEDFIETAGAGDATRVFENENGELEQIGTLGDPEMRARTVLMVDIDNDGDMDALVTALDSRFNDPDSAFGSALFENDGAGNFSEVPDTDNLLFDAGDPLEEGAQNVRYAVLTSTGPGEQPVIVTGNSFVVGLHTLATGELEVAEAAPVTESVGIDDNTTAIRDLVFGELDGNLQNGPELVVARQDGTDDLGGTNDDGEPIGDGVPDLLGELPISIRSINGGQFLIPASNDALADNCATVSLADFDNDGDLDILGGCAATITGQTQNIFLENDGEANFTVRTNAIPSMETTAAVSLVGDFNGDGWMDAYIGGGFDDEPGEDFILLNNGDGGTNNWLQIELDADTDDAIGAQVYVGADEWQVRETGHTLHRGQDSRILHFGLGSETNVAPAQIRWPDGTFETCVLDGVNQRQTISQGGNNCVASSQAGLQAAISVDPGGAPALLCNGEAVTVNIAAGETPSGDDDVILGTDGADVINGLGGNDTICGLGGNDTISGGKGADTILGGLGADVLTGNNGADVIAGGRGKDTISGGSGPDELRGNAGKDTIAGGNGADLIIGGAGNDALAGGSRGDDLRGGAGNDSLAGGKGADVLNGGAGRDSLNGNNGTDTCTADPDEPGEVITNCEQN